MSFGAVCFELGLCDIDSTASSWIFCPSGCVISPRANSARDAGLFAEHAAFAIIPCTPESGNVSIANRTSREKHSSFLQQLHRPPWHISARFLVHEPLCSYRWVTAKCEHGSSEVENTASAVHTRQLKTGYLSISPISHSQWPIPNWSSMSSRNTPQAESPRPLWRPKSFLVADSQFTILQHIFSHDLERILTEDVVGTGQKCPKSSPPQNTGQNFPLLVPLKQVNILGQFFPAQNSNGRERTF